ncbi:heat shock protein HSP29 [Besnoitia besnoiti]|uniref:Heat shock protein HSP29 n=1 Tax=Besnoitia besnoiti TaxID=94643 RepID=A0A2A9M9Q4_BESBE|nr:heat shock protein HSP29 [Besnoitia besnoiti]PFH32102.1 heat shock protein HSP29 [Besnoitia besnoiti]
MSDPSEAGATPHITQRVTTIPGGTTTTTRTTTYTVRSVPVKTTTSSYAVRSSAVAAGPTTRKDSFTFDDLKRYFEDQGKLIMEDPRTKHLIESGQATWEDVKKYLDTRAPRACPVEGSNVVYSATGGYWYPVVTGTAMVAAPNSIFEVGPDSAEICNKISFRPRLDAYYDANGKRLVLFFDLPGFEKKDVEIELDKGALAVSGERPKSDDSTTTPDGKDLIKERLFGFFYRKFQLPANAVEDSIKASMEQGVLEVAIGLKDESTPTKKKIDVQ